MLRRVIASRTSLAIAARVGVAVGGRLGQGALDDPVGRHHLGPTRERRRLAQRDAAIELDDRLAREGRLAGDHLEQDRTHREQVRRRHDRLAVPLLRRHIARGTQDRPRRRKAGIHLELLEERTRETEIEQLGPVRAEKDVRGLEITMHDATGVQCAERPEDAQGDLECLGQWDLSPGDAIRERFTGEQLHDEIEPLGIFGELVDLADVGMIETGGGAGFPEETLVQRVGGGPGGGCA